MAAYVQHRESSVVLLADATRIINVVDVVVS
jgi:hypothetical protein